MGFNNPRHAVVASWRGTLSGAAGTCTSSTRWRSTPTAATRRRGPASARRTSRRRSRCPSRTRCPYAELHCHTNFSFLDGASHPEELAEEAARLGLTALAITDHDGFYGVVRFSEAARELGLPTIFGAELSLDLGREAGHGTREPDPDGRHLLVLAHGTEGYARLSRIIGAGAARRRGEGPPGVRHLEERRRPAARPRAGAHRVPQGDACRRRCSPTGVDAAARELDRLARLFGADNVAVELTDHGDPTDDDRNDALAALAAQRGLPTVATNNVHYATPARRRLATALAAVRARRSLDEIDRWLPAAATAHLRSGAEMAQRFAAYPGAVARAAEYGRDLAFDLQLVAPKLPDYQVPDRAHRDGPAAPADHGRRAGPLRAAGGASGGLPRSSSYELNMIEQLGFPGYFLVVYDIVKFCRDNRHLLPGAGLGGQLRGLLRAVDHQCRRGPARAALRALPRAGTRRAARHRRRHRVRPAGGGHPARLREVRPAAHRPGRQRDLLPAAVGGARHGQGLRLLARASRTRGASRSTGGVSSRRSTSTTSRSTSSTSPTSCRPFPGTWASTPAAW